MSDSTRWARRATTYVAALALLAAVQSATASARPRPGRVASAAATTDWPAYLDGPLHSSFNAADTAITPANASNLSEVWHWEPPKPTMHGQPPGLQSSPIVSAGRIYIGSRTGNFYALDEATGKVLWSHFFGFRPHLTCSAQGFISTATVAVDPSSGKPAVYVADPSGYLDAMDAATGAILWQSVIAIPSSTVSDYFDWSSPTVANGHIYVGISSQCDHPLVQAGAIAYDQATGHTLATYFVAPSGVLGGSIWSSAAVLADGSVVVTTGNEQKTLEVGDDYSVVHLNGNTMAKIDSFQIPKAQLPGSDNDFGGSPTSFAASIDATPTQLVGACNKNGVYYALNQANFAAGPVWTMKVGDAFPTDPNQPGQCDAAAAWDGVDLYIGGNGTTINGKTVVGSISQVNPATGVPIWRTGLPGEVIGSPSLDGAGVVAAPMMGSSSGNGVALVNASTGAILTTLTSSAAVFAQPVFANGMLFVAAGGAEGLRAYAPGS
ncbi:MAG TPA: PQQ-binding-like beta-propeller repeat protein [Acidimicrobiales bacterium]|jgi:outer membrane protein assembly factor BamB|nr:PQQ-binding-like beta-propeller repeat protein [Acidimicrobiales bacterium]